MISKIKEWLEPLNEVKLSEIVLAIILAFFINAVLSFVGIEAVGYVLAVIFVLVDVVFAIMNKDLKRILSKALGYGVLFVLAAGFAKYLDVSANFSFIALVAFSFTEIFGSVRGLLKI